MDSNNGQGFRHGVLHVRGTRQRHDPPRIFGGKGFVLPCERGNSDSLSKSRWTKTPLRTAIDATGYTAGEIHAAPYEKKGLFSFLEKANTEFRIAASAAFSKGIVGAN